MRDDIEQIIGDSDGLSHLSDGEMIETCETLAEVFTNASVREIENLIALLNQAKEKAEF